MLRFLLNFYVIFGLRNDQETLCHKNWFFTVFLVVMVITMLKSVVDSAPILFVRLGQDNVGAIDFTLKADSTTYKRVPMNYYNINPFVGLFAPPVPEDDSSS